MKKVCPICAKDIGVASNCSTHPTAIVRDVFLDGTKLAGTSDTFEIVKCLSLKGGTAVTYLAKDSSGNQVVIKQLIVNPDPDIHKDNEIRFEREAIFLQTLSSPLLPAGLDRFDENGHKLFVQEFIDGSDLSDYIKANGVMSEDDALEVGIQCLQALGLLHDFVSPTTGNPNPILHRDIKPDNILLRKGTLKPVLIDFGSAVDTSAALVGQTVSIPGTPGYISQSRINGIENETDDLFGLAYTIIFLITGDEPQDNNKNRDKLLKKLPSSWRQNFEFATQDISLPGRANAQIGLRPKSWKIFQNQLIALLSPAQQVRYGINPQPAQQSTPAQPVSPPVGIYTIDFQSSNPYMVDPHTYARNIQGRVFLNGQPAHGLTITPMISDIGGKSAANGPGKSITTGTLGDFVLDYSDCEVPISVSQRDMELILTDSTGNQLHTDQITIFKPRSAGVSAAKASFWEALKAPLEAFSTWRANRAAIKSAVAQANLQNNTNLLQAKNRLTSAKANAKSAKLAAIQRIKQQLAQQKLTAKQAPGYVSPGTHIWNIARIIVPLGLLATAIYFLYSPVYEFLTQVEWSIWGWRIGVGIAAIIVLYLLYKILPAIYRYGKRKSWGTSIKGWFSSLWSTIQKTPAVIKAFVIGGLIVAIFIGFALKQNWLVLFPLGLLPLMFGGFKFNLGMMLRLLVSFLLLGIAFAVSIKDVQQLLKLLGGQ